MVRMRRKERLEIPDSDNVLAEVLELVLSLDLDQVSPPWTYCKSISTNVGLCVPVSLILLLFANSPACI